MRSTTINNLLPGLQVVRNYRSEWFSSDLLAGLSVAAGALESVNHDELIRRLVPNLLEDVDSGDAGTHLHVEHDDVVVVVQDATQRGFARLGQLEQPEPHTVGAP